LQNSMTDVVTADNLMSSHDLILPSSAGASPLGTSLQGETP
jgi:hypothetical protein